MGKLVSLNFSSRMAETGIMVQRDTGRPRGFGFVTFSDKRAMEAAISEMHNKEFGGWQISVNKADLKVTSDDTSYGYGGGGRYSSGGKGGYRGHADDSLQIGLSECFKCRCLGHLACECPSDGGERFSSRSGINGGGGGGRGDRYNERWRYDGGRYDENRYGDAKDSRDNGGRNRYASNCYLSVGDHFSGELYGSRPDKYPSNGYNNKRRFNKNGGPHGGGGGGGGDSHRYGSGGPTRYDGGGNYQERPGPYGRPGRGSRPASFDDQY